MAEEDAVYVEKTEANVKDNPKVSDWTIGRMVLPNMELKAQEKTQIWREKMLNSILYMQSLGNLWHIHLEMLSEQLTADLELKRHIWT